SIHLAAHSSGIDSSLFAQALNENRVQALPHLGEPLMNRHRAVVLHYKQNATVFGHAVAYADILDAAGYACKLRVFVCVAHGEKSLLESDAVLELLSGGERVADIDRIAPTYLPPVDAYPLGKLIQRAFHSERGLICAESPHSAARRIVGVDGQRFDIH